MPGLLLVGDEGVAIHVALVDLDLAVGAGLDLARLLVMERCELTLDIRSARRPSLGQPLGRGQLRPLHDDGVVEALDLAIEVVDLHAPVQREREQVGIRLGLGQQRQLS